VQESNFAELNNTGPLLPQRQEITKNRHDFCGLHDTNEPVQNVDIPEQEEERR